MGRRVSIQLTSGLLNSLLWASAINRFLAGGFLESAELDFGVGLERVGWKAKVCRCRPMPHASGCVVLAAVARAEPTAPLPARIGRLVPERHATEVGADTDQHDPLRVPWLHSLRVWLRLNKLGHLHILSFLDLLVGAMTHEDRLALPKYRDSLAGNDRGQIHVNR